jgi:hypothetical protein
MSTGLGISEANPVKPYDEVADRVKAPQAERNWDGSVALLNTGYSNGRCAPQSDTQSPSGMPTPAVLGDTWYVAVAP